jgi:hypothetical protein
MSGDASKCAKEDCKEPAYTGNAMSLSSPIGTVIVYLCKKCFAEFIQANMLRQIAKLEKDFYE